MSNTNAKVASTDYKELKNQAMALGMTNAHTIKKAVLMQLVQAEYDKISVNETDYDKPGRPIDSNSARQKRIADLEKRRAEGTLKLGRPAESDSKRQQRLAEKQAQFDAYNAQQAEIAKGVVIDEADILPNPASLGRRINPDSPRQIALREYEAKKAAGLIKKGRPSFAELGKMTKEEEAKAQKTVIITDKVDEPVINVDVENRSVILNRATPKRVALFLLINYLNFVRMELESSEVNTVWLALKTAITKQNELASQYNNPTFIRNDYNQLLVKVEKWQRKQVRKQVNITIK